MKTHWVADLYPLNEDDVAALGDTGKGMTRQWKEYLHK
jgi:hypothetical protein